MTGRERLFAERIERMGRRSAVWVGPCDALLTPAVAGREGALPATDVASLLAWIPSVLLFVRARMVRYAQWEHARDEFVWRMDCNCCTHRHSVADQRWSAASRSRSIPAPCDAAVAFLDDGFGGRAHRRPRRPQQAVGKGDTQ